LLIGKCELIHIILILTHSQDCWKTQADSKLANRWWNWWCFENVARQTQNCLLQIVKRKWYNMDYWIASFQVGLLQITINGHSHFIRYKSPRMQFL